MNTQLLDEAQLETAVALLRRGEPIAFPTDTVYGLAALPDLPAAVAKLFEAKSRPLDKAIPLLLADAGQLGAVGIDLTTAARRLAGQLWPGGLTIVVRRRNLSDDAPDTVAVRVPDLPLARRLILLAGGALAVTSANLSGGSNCTSAPEVLAQLGGRIAAIVDGGVCPGGTESTVVDATVETVRVLRLGAVSRQVLSDLVVLA